MTRQTSSRRWHIWLAALLILAGGSMFWVRHWKRANATEYRTFTSPDGEYRVVVYSVPSLTSRMPGQAGDAEGFVRLYNRAGAILQEKPVSVVQSIDRVEWEPGWVRIKLFADWPISGTGYATPK